MIVAPTRLFPLAYGHFALGAYSVNNLEQMRGLLLGSVRTQAPFILAISRRAIAYAGLPMLLALVRAAEAESPEAIFAVHLDHGDEATCMTAIDTGIFTSVMIDAAHAAFDENCAITRRVVERGHAAGLSVEAELGRIGGKEEDRDVSAADAFLTDPAQAAEFVARTGVDSLAVAAGTSHGPAKFHAGEGLRLDRLAQIQAALPGVPLVLHGASGVNRAEIERANAAGASLDPTARGVSAAEIAGAIPLGVAKINIDTDSRLLWLRVHREYLRDHPDALDFRQPGQEFMEAYAAFVAAKSLDLGSANRRAEVATALANEAHSAVPKGGSV